NFLHPKRTIRMRQPRGSRRERKVESGIPTFWQIKERLPGDSWHPMIDTRQFVGRRLPLKLADLMHTLQEMHVRADKLGAVDRPANRNDARRFRREHQVQSTPDAA